MIRLFAGMALAVAIFPVRASTNENDAPSDREALSFAAKAAFASKVAECKDQNSKVRHFILSREGELTEIDQPKYLPIPVTLTRADQLNGIDYDGQLRLVGSAYRVFNNKSGSWSEWIAPTSWASIASPISNAGIVAYLVRVQHKKGEWSVLGSTLKDVADVDCAIAHAIETGTRKENTVQLNGEAPRPFEPNAVLSRPIPWKNNCIAAAGTKIIDLGPDKDMADYRSAVVDPAVCHPESGLATAGPVAADAIETIEQWKHHPAATAAPPPTPAPVAAAAEVPTPEPVAAENQAPRPVPTSPHIDPSRVSASHNPTQTFYTRAAVPVFVRGYNGAVLCVVPARAPVPARVDNRAAQSNGNFGVLAYKADLCPDAAGSQPRDMYHEFFFRATGR